ncbi:MAG TPA: SH3 domain-containing protein [Terriglobales bacterium]|nr:SH3 domain-containing protein [Terriglobales bacterium]
MDPIVEQAAVPTAPTPRNRTFALRKSPLDKARGLRPALSFFLLLSLVVSLYAKTKSDSEGSFSIEIPVSESEVLQAVKEVVNNGMIQGSKEYNRDRYVENASPATSSPLFPPWTDPGHVFYKVRTKVLAPVNFKGSNDEGTLAVRYVVAGKGPQQTLVRIDAVFVEDFRRVAHRSNGTVESAEYKDIQEHVDALELKKKQAAEAEQHRQEVPAQRSLDEKKEQDQTSAVQAAPPSGETLEQHVENLRHQLERVVRTSGIQLKSAPFASATNLKTLDGGTQVVVLIITPYWYGVETEEGQHGWINRSELESLP